MRLWHHPRKIGKYTGVWPLLLVLSFIFSQEAIMAYLYPIILEETIQNAALMGLILGSSSIIGFATDMFLPFFFRTNSWKSQLILAFLFGLPFSLLVYLGQVYHTAWLFLLAAWVWGFFFELQAFAQQNYIVDQEPKIHHSRDWGAVHAIWIAGGIVGAIIGALLHQMGGFEYVLVSMGLLFAGLVTAVTLSASIPYKKSVQHQHGVLREGFFEHFRNLKKLFISYHPLVIVGALGTFVEASFWSFGALFVMHSFSAEMGEWVVLIIFLIMTMVSVLILEQKAPTKGRGWLIKLLLWSSGLWLLPFFFEPVGYWALALIAGFGLAFGAITPLNESLFSDVLSEAKVHDQDILSLDKSGNSLGYALGPPMMGLAAEYLGYYNSFALLGVLCCVSAGLLHLSTSKVFKR